MKRIDIIGPPGVGKTTLMKIMTSRENGLQFITREDALFKACKKIKINKFDALAIRYYFLIDKNEASRRFVNAFSDEKFYKEVVEEYLELIKKKAEERFNDEKYSPHARLRSFNKYQTLLKELYVLDKVKPEGIVVYDESVTHQTSMQSLLDLFSSRSSSYIYPMAVIYLDAAAECIIDRIKSREKRKIPRHRSLTDDKLLEDTQTVIQETRKKVSHLKRFGVKVLRINAEDDINNIYREATDWIDTLNHSEPVLVSDKTAAV